MSSLRKVGKNWTIEFYYWGRYYHRSLRVTKKADAVRLQRQIDFLITTGQLDVNRLVQPEATTGTLTLHDFLREVEAHLLKMPGRYRARTLQTYLFYIRRSISLLADVPLTVINKRYVEASIIPVLERTRSYEGVRSFLIHLRRFFTFAVEWGYLEKNPFSGIIPRRRKRLPRSFSDDEIGKMLAYLYQRPLWQLDFVVLALSTGLRMHELFGLEWDQVTAQYVRVVGKGGKERLVPLNTAARAILMRRPRDGQRVFPEITSMAAVKSMWRRLRQQTGIRGRFHDLRATWASRNLMAGIPIAQLKEWGGWESYEMINVYAAFVQGVAPQYQPVDVPVPSRATAVPFE